MAEARRLGRQGQLAELDRLDGACQRLVEALQVLADGGGDVRGALAAAEGVPAAAQPCELQWPQSVVNMVVAGHDPSAYDAALLAVEAEAQQAGTHLAASLHALAERARGAPSPGM
eukprot:TRINITY_DN21784_c0_g1_i1.p1 TRINITY_DN21784_c0_g1~~TRINITY_DN21784_c0_g1_i1.p1  ORF type:complete len:116 (+),score=21.36 TRINITY_DN21784_c0_g1_i1:75-422(+)